METDQKHVNNNRSTQAGRRHLVEIKNYAAGPVKMFNNLKEEN